MGGIVRLGKYEQDGDEENGKESIDWVVLKIEDGKALIISELALDAQCYNKHSDDVTWESCSLRAWLNKNFIVFPVCFNTLDYYPQGTHRGCLGGLLALCLAREVQGVRLINPLPQNHSRMLARSASHRSLICHSYVASSACSFSLFGKRSHAPLLLRFPKSRLFGSPKIPPASATGSGGPLRLP